MNSMCFSPISPSNGQQNNSLLNKAKDELKSVKCEQTLTVTFRAHLNQASASMRQHDASDPVLIENSGVTPVLGCNPCLSNSIVFNENYR